jgi:hypothetical protein
MSEERKVKPWDLFNKNMERALPLIAEKRLDICKQCPRYVKLTHQCKECGCIMNAKVKLADASCPLNKWNSIKSVPIDREITEEELKNF